MSEELKARFVAAGEKIKEKGWKSASLDVGVHYLAIFDREPYPGIDPMISFSASIRSGSPYNYVDGWTFDSLESAIAALEKCAAEMPTFAHEEKRKSEAIAKLSLDELRLIQR
jgi:hypothetical protein